MSDLPFWNGVKLLSEAFVERVDVDVFDSQAPAVPAIELAAVLCVSGVDPIGDAVTCARKSTSLNKGLQQDGFIAVAQRPIVAQMFGGGCSSR